MSAAPFEAHSRQTDFARSLASSQLRSSIIRLPGSCQLYDVSAQARYITCHVLATLALYLRAVLQASSRAQGALSATTGQTFAVSLSTARSTPTQIPLPFVDAATRTIFLLLASISSFRSRLCAPSHTTAGHLSRLVLCQTLSISQRITLTTNRTLKYPKNDAYVLKIYAWQATPAYNGLDKTEACSGAFQERWPAGRDQHLGVDARRACNHL